MTSVQVATPLDRATVEQLLRWQMRDSWAGSSAGTPLDVAAQAAVEAAEDTPDQFARAVSELARHSAPASTAYLVDQALQGDPASLEVALEHNAGLQSLHRTVAQRAEGADVGEIATMNGLRLRAEHTGEAYQTVVFVGEAPGRSDVLAGGTVAAGSATQALRIAAEREHAAHGLDQTDVRMIDQQVARLEQLIAPDGAETGRDTAGPTTNRWAATVAQTVGEDLHADPGWATLAPVLDRAASAGWDVAAQLPAVAAAAPLTAHGSVAHELAYRVMDACPDAVPPPPSVAQINGTEPASTGRQREVAERAIAPAPAPSRPPTVSR